MTDEIKARGGHARAKALNAKRRREIAKKAAESRWSKGLPVAHYTGELKIGENTIGCAVLEDGRRVLTQSDMMRAMGRARQAKGRAYYDGDVNLPAFLTAKNLKPFITNELYVTSSQIEFRLPSGHRAFGYVADTLPQVCDVYLQARDAGELVRSQLHIAHQAEILIRGLANVGIVGLVDEATGYQDVRNRFALQEILDAFLRKELAAWAKRFPDEFYKQIYRLRGWEWKGRQFNPPQVVAHYTTDFVYERLAPGIRDELERRMPRTPSGNRKGKLHQLFTEDIGHPALAQHIHAVTTLMRASEGWDQFKAMMDRSLPKRGDNLQLPFVEEI